MFKHTGHAVPEKEEKHVQEPEATRRSLVGFDRLTLLLGGGLLHLLHTRCGADMVVIVSAEPPEVVSKSKFPVSCVSLEVFRRGLFAVWHEEANKASIVVELTYLF